MTMQAFPVIQSTPRINRLRQRVLRIHGSLLLLVALASALYSTVARFAGVGPYAFLQQNPMAWVGLIQAYLLMAVVAVCLLIGGCESNVRKWHVIAALAHLAPPMAVLFSWGLLNALGFGAIAIGSLTFHTLWIVIETTLALYPDAAH